MIYKHLKSGKYYKFLGEVINATNSAKPDELDMILYSNDAGDLFVRIDTEFFKNFEATELKEMPK